MAGYRIVRKLGAGGMGTVFIAVQEPLGREVALKQLSETSEELAARFKREMKLISQLDHPNIVRVYDWGEMDGKLFYAMELVPGASLAEEKPGDFPRAARLMLQAADALAYLHERHMWHRDLKPLNFVVEEPGRLVLLDFGLAKVEEGTRLTLDGALVGTLRYVAPEMLGGAAGEGPADVYALACTAHEIVAGQPAVPGGTLPQIIAAIRAPERPSLAGVKGVPEWFVALQARALALVPAERPTAAEYRDALRAHGASGTAAIERPAELAHPAPSTSRRGMATAGARASGAIAVPRGSAGVPAEREAPGSRTPRGALVAGALVVFALGALAGATLRGPRDAHEPVASSPAASAGPSAAPPAATPSAPAPARSDAPLVSAAPTPPTTWGAVEIDRLRRRAARSFKTLVGEDSAAFHFHLDRPYVMVCELLDWSDRKRSAAPRGYGWYLDGLAPDHEYALRIRIDDGPLLIDTYRFRTRPKTHAITRDAMLAELFAAPDRATRPLDWLIENPDLKNREHVRNYVCWRTLEVLGPNAIRFVRFVLRARDKNSADNLYETRLTEAKDPALRAEIMLAAVDAGNPSAIVQAVQELDGATHPVQVEAGVRATLAMGWIGTSHLQAARGKARVQPWLFGQTFAFMSPAAAFLLTHGATRTDTGSIIETTSTLAELGHDGAARLLGERIRNGMWPAGPSASALGAIGSKAAREELGSCLTTATKREDKVNVLFGIQRAGDFKFVDAVERFVPDPDEVIARHAIAALAASGNAAAVPALTKALGRTHTDAALAAWALGSMAALVPSDQRPPILRAVRPIAASDGEHAGLAAWALGALGGASAAPELRAMLDGSELRAMGAAWGLVECGDAAAAPLVRRSAAAPGRAQPVRAALAAAADRLEGRAKLDDGARTIVVPATVHAARTGLWLTAGQSFDVEAVGAWGWTGMPIVSVAEVTTSTEPKLPLRLTALVRDDAWLPRGPLERIVVPRDGQVILEPIQGVHPGLTVASPERPRGFAIVTLSP